MSLLLHIAVVALDPEASLIVATLTRMGILGICHPASTLRTSQQIKNFVPSLVCYPQVMVIALSHTLPPQAVPWLARQQEF